MKPDRIILHHSLTADSGTVSLDAIRRYHMETLGWADIGYHLGIELVGNHYEILTGRMLTETGAHVAGHNTGNLGICLVGNFDIAPPPPEQWELALRLVRSLCDVFGITPDLVFGHREFTTAKTCPGKLFDIDKFRGAI